MKQKRGLFRSMIWGITLLMIVTVLLFDGMIMINSWNKEEKQNLAASESLTEKIQNATKIYVEQMDSIISSIYYDLYSDSEGVFFELLSPEPYTSNLERIAINRYLNNFFSRLYLMQPDLISAYIYVNESKSYYYSTIGHPVQDYSPLSSDWYNETIARNGKTYARLNYLPEGTTYKKPVIGFSRKLKNIDGEGISEDAVILLEFSVSMIEDIISNYVVEANTQVLFLNDAGEVIHYLGENYITERILPEQYDFNNQCSATIRHGNSLLMLSMGGRKIQEWYVAILMDCGVLLNSFKYYLITSVLLAFVMIVLAMIPASVYVKKLCNEIKMLEQGMAKLCRGNFSIRLETERSDEFGSLVGSFNTMAEKTQTLIRQQYEQELEKRDAQYKYLQAQINPHFIFNTLQVISSIALVNHMPEIESVSNALARLLSYGMGIDSKEIQLADELKNVDRYMLIRQARFKNRLSYHMDVERELYAYTIIPMTLQPIVENAISHGFNLHGGQGSICIRGYRREDHCLLEVQDDGVGMQGEYLEQLMRFINGDDGTQIQVKGHGVGLRNINHRLKLYYGEEYGIEIQSVPEGGTIVTVRIPAKGGAHAEADDRG